MIALVACEETHRWLLYEWRNRPEVADFMYSTEPISRETHDLWFSRLAQGGDRQGWVITMDGDPVGAAFMSQIDLENRRASWAFYLAEPTTRGRGVGGAVEYLVLEHAFSDLQLHKLCCEVLSFNEAVVAMHKKYGFVEEGLLRDHWSRNGEFVHTHVLAMFEDVWAARREEFATKLHERALIA